MTQDKTRAELREREAGEPSCRPFVGPEDEGPDGTHLGERWRLLVERYQDHPGGQFSADFTRRMAWTLQIVFFTLAIILALVFSLPSLPKDLCSAQGLKPRWAGVSEAARKQAAENPFAYHKLTAL